jgi:predicted nucleotidyltransferase
MDSGDLDNDGDIDFVINGIEIVNGVNSWRKYIYLREGNTLVKEEDFNNQFNSDNGVKNGSVIIADNQFDGDLDIIIVGETDSRNQINTLINKQCENDWDCNNYNGITNLNFSSTALFGNYIYYMGQMEI